MNDPQLLPPNLAAQSLSPLEIVLPYQEALEAIEHLTARGYFVFAWEGWIKIADGRHGHSRQHQGNCEYWGTDGQPVQERIREAALFVQQTIEEAQQQWNNKPEVVGATLYFCFSIEAP